MHGAGGGQSERTYSGLSPARSFAVMIFTDRLTIDAPRRTRDGYLVTRARASRTGVYSYDGREIDPDNAHGLRDAGPVNVLRDENTVFDEKAARSFIGKPVTDDHPMQPVTADNWRDNARGMVMGAMRDGDYLAFDLLLTDAQTIKKIEDGKRELSNGYAADLEFGSFMAEDGTACVARQASISGNHVALVDRGRAGANCRIKDVAVCDAATAEVAERMLAMLDADDPYGDVEYADPGYQSDKKKRYPIDTEEHIRAAWNYVHKKENADKYSSADLAKVKAKIVAAWKAKIDKAGPPSATKDGRTYSGKLFTHKNDGASGDHVVSKTILIDGYKFEVDDALETAVNKLQAQVKDATDAKTAAETKVGELTAQISTKDGEIAALTQKVKDAELNPAQLEKLVADRATLVAQAKAIDGNIVTDGKTEAEIKQAVVAAKLGDAAKDMNEGNIAGAFATLVKDVKVDPIARTLANGGGFVADAEDARAVYDAAVAKAKKNVSVAWKGPAANAA